MKKNNWLELEAEARLLNVLRRRKSFADRNSQRESYKFDDLCEEVVELHEIHGTWKYKKMVEWYSCMYISAGCPFFPHHNKWKENRLSDTNRTRLTRKYYAACIKCKKPRSFWLVSLDKPSRAKCNHCTPPVPKVKKRRKPLFRNPVIPGPTKVTKKGWCVCPTNSSVAQKCFCFGTLREIKQ